MDNILFDLLTNDKEESRQNEMLHTDRCRDKPRLFYAPMRKDSMNAAVYTSFSSARNTERFGEYERKRGIQYCEIQAYNILVMTESIGCKSIMDDIAAKKVIELAEKDKIDVVVLTSVNGFTQYPEKTFWFFDQLYRYGVTVDWIGYGNMDKAIFNIYKEESKKQEQKFEKMMSAFVGMYDGEERDE